MSDSVQVWEEYLQKKNIVACKGDVLTCIVAYVDKDRKGSIIGYLVAHDRLPADAYVGKQEFDKYGKENEITVTITDIDSDDGLVVVRPYREPFKRPVKPRNELRDKYPIGTTMKLFLRRKNKKGQYVGKLDDGTFWIVDKNEISVDVGRTRDLFVKYINHKTLIFGHQSKIDSFLGNVEEGSVLPATVVYNKDGVVLASFDDCTLLTTKVKRASLSKKNDKINIVIDSYRNNKVYSHRV